MSFTSSSSSNASFLPPPLSSNSSVSSANCFKNTLSFFIFAAFSVTNILLLLPLCILVLTLGLHRWRRQRSTAASHSDVFTYHMVTMEMIGIFGCGLYCYSVVAEDLSFRAWGLYIFLVATNGQIPFHILTCLERHLAVVHPITYLSLRKRGGVRIRNVAITCVWLYFLVFFGLIFAFSFSSVPYFCVSVVSILAVSYSSLSVLRALIRPGPGEGGGDTKRVDRSKMRAFHTIMAITGALLMRFGGLLLVVSVSSFSAISEHDKCGVLMTSVWLNLPSSLVLPLLFLHRAGKLLCCKNDTESGQGPE